KYEGSFLLVSHDRYFISKTANKIWEIEDHQIREFKGTYEEWVDWKERQLARQQNATPAPVTAAATTKSQSPSASLAPATPPAKSQGSSGNAAPATPAKPAVPPPAGKPSAPIDKEAKKELQKQQRIFQDLEQRIAVLSRQKEKLEASLADPA